MTRAFDELVVQFGQSTSLLGILTRPSPEVTIQRPAVLILNTGIAHRTGHHRMYVKMAREFAAAGQLAFRFDLSGIGDSASREEGLSPIEAHRADIAEALDWLTASYCVDNVVLIGLCSGADTALNYGYSDERVTGLVLLDPTIPPTARFYAHYIRQRLTQARSWRSFISGRGRIWQEFSDRVRLALGAEASPEPATAADNRVRSELEQLYLKSLDRDLKLLIVLTGGPLEGRQSYREQLFEALPNVPFDGRVRVEHFKDADHTFTPVSSRERLQKLVQSWIKTIPIAQNLSSAAESNTTSAVSRGWKDPLLRA